MRVSEFFNLPDEEQKKYFLAAARATTLEQNALIKRYEEKMKDEKAKKK